MISGDRSLELSENYCATTTFIICMQGQIDEMKYGAMLIFVSQKNLWNYKGFFFKMH